MTRFRKPKRASTVAVDEGRIARHIVPLIGGRIAAEITRPDVQRMADAIAAGKTAVTVKTRARGVARVTGGAGTAARVVELFGGIWTWAEKRGVVSGRNPAHGVETQRGQAKDRVLSRAELAALGKAIDAAAERYPQAASALRLIVLTGMRREEAVGLRWREVDLDGSSLRLEATKSGRSTRPIGKAAVEHLKAVPATNEEWVFPNRSGDGSADLKRQIAAIFDAAGLKDARSHDTRRTFASVAAELEYGDATIAELIGHARRGVTERHYVRRPDATLIAAADRVARVIDGYMSGTEAKIVAMSRKEMNRRE
jgi:integrase